MTAVEVHGTCTCEPGVPCAGVECEHCCRVHGCPADETPAAEFARGRRDGVTEDAVAIAGAATLRGWDHQSWTEARLCDCTDRQHAELDPAVAPRDWQWSPDVDQVQACRVFYGGTHVVTRQRVVATSPTGVAA